MIQLGTLLITKDGQLRDLVGLVFVRYLWDVNN
jgi:hypothetical protein